MPQAPPEALARDATQGVTQGVVPGVVQEVIPCPRTAIGELNHWAILSLTRFYLAFIIFNAHFGLTVSPSAHLMVDHPYYLFGRQLGSLAAILGFLAISGYSIAHSYGRPENFYGRRVGRVWPSLIFATLGFAAALYVWGPITNTLGPVHHAPSFISFVGTLLGVNAFFWPSFMGPTWSLSVEMFFYAATPLLARARLPVLAGLMAVSAATYWLSFRLDIDNLSGARYGLAALALFWAWGVGFLFQRRPSLVTAFLLTASGAFLLTKLNYEGGYYATDTWLIAAGAIVAGHAVRIDLGRFRAVMNYLGDLSYPLYLVHYPVIVVANGVFGMTEFLPILALCLGAAALCLGAVEVPLRRRLPRLPIFRRQPERFAPAILGVVLLGAALAWFFA